MNRTTFLKCFTSQQPHSLEKSDLSKSVPYVEHTFKMILSFITIASGPPILFEHRPCIGYDFADTCSEEFSPGRPEMFSRKDENTINWLHECV